MIEQAVILAAGRGTRLGQIAVTRSKALLPVAGKPLLGRVIDTIRETGLRRIVVVAGENIDEINRYISCNESNIDGDIVVCQQQMPLGTADALLTAQDTIQGSFLLISVDNIVASTELRLLIAHFNSRYREEVTLGLVHAPTDEIAQSASVEIDGQRVTRIVEKPANPQDGYASIMVYACSRRFLNDVARVKVSPRGEKELPDAVQAYLNKDGWVGYRVFSHRLHLTYPADLLTMNHHFMDQLSANAIHTDLPLSTKIFEPVCVDYGVRIGDNVELGPHVYLESGCEIGNDVRIANCVVMNGAVVNADATYRNKIITANAVINAG
jgi:bifunctional UDP-N-acetylglucosamine pyrophosphorylase/glucosamine-1-phosphate N-acetyltransferase